MNKSINHYLLVGITYSIMLMFGFVENLKGMAVPPIRKEFGADFSSIGFMIFCCSMGYLLTCVIGGRLCDRFGHKKILAFGYILLIFSTFMMAFAPNIIIVSLLMFLMFGGMGLFEVGNNALAGLVFTKNTAIMMNFLHLFYGLGSIIGPKFAAVFLLNDFSWKQYYMIASGVVTFFFFLMMMVKFPSEHAEHKEERLPLKVLLSDKSIWLLGIALGFAVTLELGTSNWLVNYLSSEYRMNENNTSFYMSMFYVTFVIGRLIGGFIAEKAGYNKTIIMFTFVTVFLYSAAMIMHKEGAMLISLGGFFIAIIFPTAMAIVVKDYKKGMSSVMGFVIALSAIVNMIFNWVIGKVNDVFGVYLGFSSFILYGILTILFFGLFEISIKKEIAEETSI